MPDPSPPLRRARACCCRCRSTAPMITVLPEDLALAPGDFVRVPLGGRTLIGVVWGEGSGAVESGKLKAIAERLPAPPLRAELRRLVDWVAHYTLSPPGAVLRMAMSVPDALLPPRADDRLCPERPGARGASRGRARAHAGAAPRARSLERRNADGGGRSRAACAAAAPAWCARSSISDWSSTRRCRSAADCPSRIGAGRDRRFPRRRRWPPRISRRPWRRAASA